MKILFIFIDGVGIRPPADDNPVCPEVCPTLCRLINEEAIPIDACLNTPGLPQSASGQTTMFTGVNASQYMGRHCEGFPGPTLRKVIENDNLFKTLIRKGLTCRFADAYLVDLIDEIRTRRFKSVTTVMALTQPETISVQDDLLNNHAVAHDITRQTFLEKGHDLPLITPQQAAEHLMEVARSYNFTLFEFFLTDLAGHSRKYEMAATVLSMLDLFLERVVTLCHNSDIQLLITSDHGNIEDLSTRSHTRNPVPLIAIGPHSETFKSKVTSLIDITPQITRLMVPRFTPTP